MLDCDQEGALLYSFAGTVTAVDKDGQPVENQVVQLVCVCVCERERERERER